MIIVRLKGGVGNQLFQYAFGKSLQAHYGLPLFYDTSRYKNDPLRQFELQSLNPPIARQQDINLFFKPDSVEKLKAKLGLDPKYKIIKEQAESEWIYSRDVFDQKNKGLYLDGYWQNPSYFESYASVLKAELSQLELPHDAVSSNDNFDSVAVHIRRGDYLTNKKAPEIYTSLSIDYYREAMSFLKSRIKALRFFIFSDDIEWCKTNLVGQDIIFTEPSEIPLYDLLTMSRMDHQIIANSTFSWWAAWLNPNSSKIIISPQQWFVSPSQNERTKSLILGNWIRL